MLFGIKAPKFIKDFDLPAEKTVNFDFCVVLEDNPVQDFIEHKSVINGHTEFINLGKHWVYTIRVHLFKYEENPDTGYTMRTKYTELKSIEGSEGILYRHRDGEPFRNNANELVTFFVESVDESYFETPLYHDLITIRFRSKDYIDKSKSVKALISDEPYGTEGTIVLIYEPQYVSLETGEKLLTETGDRIDAG